MATQKLAVGTNEGAVVMYDLKTAIRLYVLEGHKKPIAACSFSPDGRRLITISLKESLVLVGRLALALLASSIRALRHVRDTVDLSHSKP